ncbi:MAG: hypothetical protein M3463_22400 [Verrucomicrobiota bacterium]|nr:hypothetical protein [Verrucomicrobiota bacterium]
MIDRSKIQIQLVKLASGERLLRLTESDSGLALEKIWTPHNLWFARSNGFSPSSRRLWRSLRDRQEMSVAF